VLDASNWLPYLLASFASKVRHKRCGRYGCAATTASAGERNPELLGPRRLRPTNTINLFSRWDYATSDRPVDRSTQKPLGKVM
jgi:hypothetical protein